MTWFGRLFGRGDDSARDEAFLRECAAQTEPCARSMEELEARLCRQYGAEPHSLLPLEREILQANVILAYYPEAAPGNDFDAARRVDPEALGLSLAVYRLPDEVPAPQADKRGHVRVAGDGPVLTASFGDSDVLVELERKSGYVRIVNGGDELRGDLLRFLGVSRRDIDSLSPRFRAYARTVFTARLPHGSGE